jgi:uncharacterized protein YcbX
MTVVGHVESLWRYPVKSMAGEQVAEAFVGYAGVFGDRHCAFINAAAPAGFPYFTGRAKAEMLLYRPRFRDAELAARPLNQQAAEKLGPGITPLYPTPPERLAVDVTAPSGEVLAVDDPALLALLATKTVEADKLSLIRSDRALTDCRPVSLISSKTISQLGDELDTTLDPRRFRANIYADLGLAGGFAEDRFVGKSLQIGERAVIAVLDRDPRCKMISIDPVTAEENSEVLRTVAKAHDNKAGVYCAVLTEGTVRQGDTITVLG